MHKDVNKVLRYSNLKKTKKNHTYIIIRADEAKWNCIVELHFIVCQEKKKRLVIRSVTYVLYFIALQMLISTIAAYVRDNLS